MLPVCAKQRRGQRMRMRLGFRHISVRPHNRTQDPAAIEAHKKTSPPS